MSELLHWYARIHGPRAFRVMQSARSGELDRDRENAASLDRRGTVFPADDSDVDRQGCTLDLGGGAEVLDDAAEQIRWMTVR